MNAAHFEEAVQYLFQRLAPLLGIRLAEECVEVGFDLG
jgi:hypothetical protein